MRTVKIVYVDLSNPVGRIELETEVIVDDETDPVQAGREATRFLLEFQSGMIEAAQ